jgi:DNA segregation ATPase FtsK/SpoIIIE, S-DNA-T family
MAPSDISLSRVAHNPHAPLRTAAAPIASPTTSASSAPGTTAPSFTAVFAAIAAAAAAAGTTVASTAPAPAGSKAPAAAATAATPLDTVSAPTADDSDLYEQNVTGTIAGGETYGLNSDYYATPGATTSIAQILGLQPVTIPSVVGASGGIFADPSSSGLVTPSGDANTGQMLSELQNTAPGSWSTILSGYGITDSAGINNQISQLFGVNQAVPYQGA